MMENYGRWIDVTAPKAVTVIARLADGREYELHVVVADEITSDFVVDADERIIVLPINATMVALVQALHTATQHEPPTTDAPGFQPLNRIENRPVELNPVVWLRPAA
jgi:hypothetical protein